jgi:uncharacterized protein (TIGR00251 family)
MEPPRSGQSPYTIRKGRLVLKVKAFPKSERNAVMGVRNGELVVRVQAPALEGQANRELVKFLAKTLDVSRSDIDILSGEASRHKVLTLPPSAKPSLESIL